MFLQNLKSVALPVLEVIRGTQIILAAPGYAHARSLFCKFLWAFIRIGPENVLAKFEVRSFTRSVQFSSVTIFMSRASLIIQDYDGCAHA